MEAGGGGDRDRASCVRACVRSTDGPRPNNGAAPNNGIMQQQPQRRLPATYAPGRPGVRTLGSRRVASRPVPVA